MARKVMIFTGAPEHNDLDWDEAGLLNHFLEPFAKLSGLSDIDGTGVTAQAPTSTLDVAVWRSIPLQQTHLATGFSQVHELQGSFQADNGFFNTVALSQELTQGSTDRDIASQTILSQFYDHTIAITDGMASSQLQAEDTSVEESFETTAEVSVDTSSQDLTTVSNDERAPAFGSGHLSDLEDLPDAAYLTSISPQTMGVNLIVGVISVAEPRTIKTRWGATKSLVELLVGDDTRAGFSVTFWLSTEDGSHHSAEAELHKTLRCLRKQDIILLRNVGLSSFMQKVHGHSLRKDLTKIDLLHRKKLSQDTDTGFYTTKQLNARGSVPPQLQKTRKVWNWVLEFVGGGAPSLGKRKAKGKAVRSWELPPPDSQ